MELSLSEEQAELASTVRGLLEKRADPAAVRRAMTSEAGYDADLWRTMCEQIGVAALAVPEEYDGFGASFLETALVLDELGRTVAPSPLIATAVATEALLAGGTDEAKRRLLPRVAAGEIATVLLDTGRPVLDGDRATILLAAVGDDLVELDPAVARPAWAESMDQTVRLAWVREEAIAAGTVVGDGRAARARAELAGAAGCAALAVGLGDRALSATVEHSRERVQFGRPIGSFQALKHRMAEMLRRLELARSATWAACYALGDPATDAEEAAFLTRVAASYATEAAGHLAGECIQMHGGIAITWEHDAHLLFKRAHALGRLFGAPHEHRAAVTL
jgi:alkylation response protein AidB-like acyl-CoA dehydrogenase